MMLNNEFDAYKTEDLEHILQTERMDGRIVTMEEILQICKVLVSRRSDDPSRVKEAWDAFVEHYMPQSF